MSTPKLGTDLAAALKLSRADDVVRETLRLAGFAPVRVFAQFGEHRTAMTHYLTLLRRWLRLPESACPLPVYGGPEGPDRAINPGLYDPRTLVVAGPIDAATAADTFWFRADTGWGDTYGLLLAMSCPQAVGVPITPPTSSHRPRPRTLLRMMAASAPVLRDPDHRARLVTMTRMEFASGAAYLRATWPAATAWRVDK